MKIILSLLLLIISNIALSEGLVNISAKTILLNSEAGIGTYTGDVVIKKNNTKLTASKIIIKRRDKKIQTIKIFGNEQNPIYYYDNISNKIPKITALVIYYYATSDEVILIGMVEVIDDEGNQILADKLIYNISSKEVTISANKNDKVKTSISNK